MLSGVLRSESWEKNGALNKMKRSSVLDKSGRQFRGQCFPLFFAGVIGWSGNPKALHLILNKCVKKKFEKCYSSTSLA